MTIFRVSAPGKAIVAGEYAVLAGAPAISMALNRRARVAIEEIDNSFHRIAAPGYMENSVRFSVGRDAEIHWLDELPADDALALFECVWKQSGVMKAGGLSITLDTIEFFAPGVGRKLGLGSSAALATALGVALIRTQSIPRSVESLAAEAHRDFQNGTGSGVDIMTAIQGGLIEYQIGQSALPLQWPAGLAYRLLWSGEVASTSGQLERLAKQTPRSSQDRLVALSRDVLIAWKAGDISRVLSEMRRYTHVLREFSVDHELGIFEAGHQELADLAEDHPNTVYKPCGAGGGDIGIILAASSDDVDLCTADAVKAGFVPLDISLDPDGILIEDET